MSAITKPLPELIDELPLPAQKAAREYIEFLLTKYAPSPNKKLRQSWAGALRDYKNQYTSLELQKKALELRQNIPDIIPFHFL